MKQFYSLKKFIHSLILFAALFYSQKSLAQCVPPPLGVNLDGISDYYRGHMFTDMMKSSRGPWGSATQPWAPLPAADLDASGWPKKDAGVVVATLSDPAVPAINYAGTYKLSFTGQATVKAVACSFTVSNKVYNSSTNTTTADIIVPSGQVQIMISFTGTSDGVRNVKLIRPGYAGTTKTFTDEFINAIKNFSVIRCMDIIHTNAYNKSNTKPYYVYPEYTTWAKRKLTTHSTQSGTPAIAWEYICEFANLAGVDVWINVPISADDNYITELAKLFKANLNSNRKLYVEYSNEIWNTQFPACGWNIAAVKAEVAAGDKTLNMDGQIKDTTIWGYHRTLKRLKFISEAFRTVYQATSIHTTPVRVVYSAQASYMDWMNSSLKWFKRQHGEPSNYFYACAIAPYFNAGDIEKTGTASQIAQAWLDRSGGGDKTTFLYLAKTFNLKPYCYEGGPHLASSVIGSDVNMANRVAAQRDPKMKDAVIKNLMQNWYNFGGELFMYFSMVTPYNKHGYWGMSDNIKDLNSPKWQGIKQVLAQCLTTSTVPASENENVAISPNPCSERFNMDYNSPTSESATIELIDILGNKSSGCTYCEWQQQV